MFAVCELAFLAADECAGRSGRRWTRAAVDRLEKDWGVARRPLFEMNVRLALDAKRAAVNIHRRLCVSRVPKKRFS